MVDRHTMRILWPAEYHADMQLRLAMCDRFIDFLSAEKRTDNDDDDDDDCRTTCQDECVCHVRRVTQAMCNCGSGEGPSDSVSRQEIG